MTDAEVKDACALLKRACTIYKVTEHPSVRRIEARLLAAIANRTCIPDVKCEGCGHFLHEHSALLHCPPSLLKVKP